MMFVVGALTNAILPPVKESNINEIQNKTKELEKRLYRGNTKQKKRLSKSQKKILQGKK